MGYVALAVMVERRPPCQEMGLARRRTMSKGLKMRSFGGRESGGRR